MVVAGGGVFAEAVTVWVSSVVLMTVVGDDGPEVEAAALSPDPPSTATTEYLARGRRAG